MKTKFLILSISLINAIEAFSQLKAHSGGKISIGSTSAPTYTLGVTGDIDVVASGNAYRIQGNRVLWYNSTATSNIFVGVDAGTSITTGTNNTFSGYKAGKSNTTGSYNTIKGDSAFFYNATGSYNTVTGFKAGRGASGNNFSYNSIYGYRTGEAMTTGLYNIFAGAHAGLSNTSGQNNTLVGYSSGISITTATNNSFLGYTAGYNTTGSSNTILGSQAGYYNTSGASNTFVGLNAGYNNTTASYNVYLGRSSGYLNTTGYGNVAAGYEAGNSYLYDTLCTFLGYQTDATGDYKNSTALGNGASVTASHQVRIGDANVTSIGGYANWTNISDGRFKFNVQENVKGLDFIKKLRPVTYQLNTEDIDNFIHQNMNVNTIPDSLGGEDNILSANSDYSLSKNIIRSGFIAQEVEQAASEIGFNSSIVDAPDNGTDPYALSYAEFVVPLVKAVQELSATIDSLKTQPKSRKAADNNDSLMQEIEKLKELINQCCAAPLNNNINENTTINIKLENKNNVILYQNEPNPFGNQTVIRYFIPDNLGSASMIFYNEFGAEVNKVENIDKGFGRIEAATENLASGIYSYSIVINGKVIDTKKMIRNK